MNSTQDNSLLRVLSLKDAVGIGLGAIMGAGIFVVTGVAAGIAGPAFIVALVIAGIVASFNGLSSAQLAAVYPQSGGTYEYGYRLLNPAAGFSAGWMFLVSKLTAAGVVAIGFGSYFYQLIPVVSPIVISVFAVVILTLANYFGIKKAGGLNLIIVGITLLSLIYFIISGLPEMNPENFKPFAPFGFSGIAEASALLFFAFTGYARIATLAEEVQEPESTIPRAVIITIATAIIIYVLVAIVAIGVSGSEVLSRSTSPLQTVSNSLGTPGIKFVITLGAATAMLGVLLSQILGISRMMLAMGRRKDLPAAFEKVSDRFKVPHVGIIFTGFVILVLTLAGNFEFILRTAAFSILLYYSITNISALRQNKQEQIYGKVVPALGLIGCIALAVSISVDIILVGLGILVVGFLVRWVVKKF